MAPPEGPHSHIESRDHHRVVHVSWLYAVAFCAWSGTRLRTQWSRSPWRRRRQRRCSAAALSDRGRPPHGGLSMISVHIIVDGAARAAEWYTTVLGAEERSRITLPDG